MKRPKMEGLTEVQTEVLRAIYALNQRSRAFKSVDDVAKERLRMRFGASSKPRRYFGMYLTSTWKVLEELTRKGYVDQSEGKALKLGYTNPRASRLNSEARPYRITKRGKTKVRREMEL